MAQSGENSSSAMNDGSASVPDTTVSSSSSGHTVAAGSSGNATTVVVLDTLHKDEEEDTAPDPKKDLWMTTADGRYSSKPIPVRVGGIHNAQTFYVHKDILIQSEWFRKALCGDFKEAKDQVINLPEEDPAVFHFLIAFLYEKTFTPIKPAAAALDPILDKGKGAQQDSEDANDSDSGSSTSSTSSTDSDRSRQRNRRERRRASEEARLRQKNPGQHRADCGCPRCIQRERPRCWNCGVLPPAPPEPFYPAPPNPRRHPQPPRRAQAPVAPVDIAIPDREFAAEEQLRISGEDLRTWLMAYELNLDVYVCANKYLMEDFKKAIMRSCIDMLETAGTDAAQPEVLRLCSQLYAGVPETDPLLRMILARVGFLQSLLWARAPLDTGEFLVANPHIAALMLKETVLRHEFENSERTLPPMEGEKTPPATTRPNRVVYV